MPVYSTKNRNGRKVLVQDLNAMDRAITTTAAERETILSMFNMFACRVFGSGGSYTSILVGCVYS